MHGWPGSCGLLGLGHLRRELHDGCLAILDCCVKSINLLIDGLLDAESNIELWQMRAQTT